MVEYSEVIGNEVLVKRPVAPGENVMARGEDFSKGELVLSPGRLLSPREVGVLAAVGKANIPVFRPPVVGIISTGNGSCGNVCPRPAGAGHQRLLVRAFPRDKAAPVHFGIVSDDGKRCGRGLPMRCPGAMPSSCPAEAQRTSAT
jgi:molybdopterin molybdotransferase